MSTDFRLSVLATIRRYALFACAIGLLAFGTALPASAHPTLLTTTPDAGHSVATAPHQVTLVFDEPVSVQPRGVQIEDDDNKLVRSSEVTREQDGRRLVVNLLEDLPAGRYVVRWQVTAQDGDVVDAGFDFAVATGAAGLRGRETVASAAFPLVTVLRWLFFLSLVVVLGDVVGERIARRAVPEAVRPPSLVVPAAVVGALATGGLLAQVMVATGGVGRAGYLLGVEALGLTLVAALARRSHWWLVTSPAVAVVAAESLRNHLGTQRGLAGALLVAIHLMSIGIWLGTLVHLLRVAHINRGSTARVGAAFLAYSRLALLLFGLVVATGTVAALLLVPSFGALTGTAYGRTLLVKLALVAIVAALAWFARRRLPARPGSAPQPARAEATTLVVVLAASAILVSLPTPAPATSDIGYPAPVTGPVIRLGTLAGQIAVGVTASENQLEVRLRVPDAGVQLKDSPHPDYRVAAQVSAPGARAGTVAIRPCGPACFVGPVAWQPGTSYIDLRVDAPGWHGGAAVFPIHWAPRVARDVLPRVRAAILARPSIRVVETVTSDTSRATPQPQTVTLSGRDFLDSEPYGSAPDPQAVMRARPGGGIILTFGLPAEGIQVSLEVDASYRLIAETLASPKHLTKRTFSYPR